MVDLKQMLSNAGVTHFDAGWRKFEIVFVKNLTEEDSKCWGKTDFDAGIIQLDAAMRGDLFRETLLHEITHILLENAGLGDYDDCDVPPALSNERMTVLISRTLLQAMNYNPDLFSLLV